MAVRNKQAAPDKRPRSQYKRRDLMVDKAEQYARGEIDAEAFEAEERKNLPDSRSIVRAIARARRAVGDKELICQT